MSRLVDQPTATGAVDADVIDGDLLAALGRVVDPRARRGVRHRLAVILALGAGAVLAGARSLVAIAEWASDLPPTARTRLGIGRAVPCESTIRRTLQSVDADAFDAVLGDWLAARACGVPKLGTRHILGRSVGAMTETGWSTVRTDT